LQVIVDTNTSIVAGNSRDITVKALDNGGNVAITYTEPSAFVIDGGAGPESSGSGLPNNYAFSAGDVGVHVFTGDWFRSSRNALSRFLAWTA